MKRNTFAVLVFVGVITVFGAMCVNADDASQPSKWKNAGTKISEAAGAVTDATVDSSKKAWKGTQKASGKAWGKTKDVSSDTWDKTKYTTKEAWEKAKDKIHHDAKHSSE